MDRTRTLFIIVMACVGLALAAAIAAWPWLRTAPAPAMLWIIVAVFLFDAATMLAGPRLGLTRLSSGLRFAGLLTGALLYLLADMAFTAMKAPLA